MSSLIESYAVESVTHTRRGTLQVDGTFQFNGTEKTLPCRVTDIRKKEWAGDRWEIIYDRIFWFDATSPGLGTAVAPGDRLTWSGVDHEVIDFYTGRTLAGTKTHKKVMAKIIGV
jgi:hypothetical protein